MEAPMMSPHIILEKDLKSQWLYHSKGMAWTLNMSKVWWWAWLVHMYRRNAISVVQPVGSMPWGTTSAQGTVYACVRRKE